MRRESEQQVSVLMLSSPPITRSLVRQWYILKTKAQVLAKPLKKSANIVWHISFLQFAFDLTTL